MFQPSSWYFSPGYTTKRSDLLSRYSSSRLKSQRSSQVLASPDYQSQKWSGSFSKGFHAILCEAKPSDEMATEVVKLFLTHLARRFGLSLMASDIS